jgi:hypothetical protein
MRRQHRFAACCAHCEPTVGWRQATKPRPKLLIGGGAGFGGSSSWDATFFDEEDKEAWLFCLHSVGASFIGADGGTASGLSMAAQLQKRAPIDVGAAPNTDITRDTSTP